MTKKKERVIDSFDFHFIDKADANEAFFAHLYTPKEVRNPKMVYRQKNEQDVVLEAMKKVLKGLKGKPSSPEPASEDKLRWFSAFYDYERGSLEVFLIAPGKKKLSRAAGWQAFYDYATFKEIIDAIEPQPTEAAYIALKKIRWGKADRKVLLNLIRDNPSLLMDRSYLMPFMDILEEARWNRDPKKALEAARLLKQHFVPSQRGGKGTLPPGLRRPFELMFELAGHLSKKCKVMVDFPLREGKSQILDPAAFRALTDEARVRREFRISTLSREALSKLIFKPLTFIQDLLKFHYHTTDRTIRNYLN